MSLKQTLHRVSIQRDLLVTALGVGPRRRQLQPVQGTLAGQRLAAVPPAPTRSTQRILLAHQNGQQGIVW